MMIVAGIDLGSGSAKALILREDGCVLGKALVKTRADFESVARDVRDRALAEAGLNAGDIAYTTTTGLGRYAVSFRDIQVTEITAAARGAWLAVPAAAFVLDIGAQSTRAIRLKEGGKVRDFHSNEKCAAGGGAFLVRAAKYLEIPLEAMGSRSLQSGSGRAISSVCAVLAESEIINHINDGVTVEEIVRGLHESMAERAYSQLRKVGLNGPVAVVGGVALQEGMVEAARRRFGVPVIVPDSPDFACARGAAALGLQRARKKLQEGAKP